MSGFGDNTLRSLHGFFKNQCPHKFTLKKKTPLWFCGFDPAEIYEYLSKYSLCLIEDVGHEEYLERYIKPKGRDLTVMEIERAVLAEVE